MPEIILQVPISTCETKDSSLQSSPTNKPLNLSGTWQESDRDTLRERLLQEATRTDKYAHYPVPVNPPTQLAAIVQRVKAT